MPFTFTCPYCFHKTLVSDEFAGRRGECVNCGKSITLPGSAASPQDESSSRGAGDAKQGAERTRKHRLPVWLIRLCIFSLIVIPLSLVLVYSIGPGLRLIKHERDLSVCRQNLRLIARALNEYAALHGTYPPPVIYDSTGLRPMHSWRVLILPHLGLKTLYDQYDFKVSWNSPANSAILAQCPGVFVSPAASSVGMGNETSYMLLTGPGTIFPGKVPLGPRDITDGLENTLLVAETNSQQAGWTEPKDIDVSKLSFRSGSSQPQIAPPNSIGGTHPGGANAVFASGVAAWLPDDTSRMILDSLITPAGGESIEGAWFAK